MGAALIESGQYDLGVCVGFDRTRAVTSTRRPSSRGLPHWYGDLGFMVTTQFFAMKINRYMHDFGISHDTLAKVAAKNYRNGALNPNAWRRKPFSEEEILESRMLNYPLTQYMFCSPDEGAAAVVLCRAERAHRYTDRPVYLRAVDDAHPPVRARSRCSRRGSSIDRGHSPTVDAAARVLRASRRRAVRRRRRAAPGQRVGRRDHAHGRDRALRRRRAGGDDPAGRHRDRRSACRSTPTVG